MNKRNVKNGNLQKYYFFSKRDFGFQDSQSPPVDRLMFEKKVFDIMTKAGLRERDMLSKKWDSINDILIEKLIPQTDISLVKTFFEINADVSIEIE